MVNEEYPYISSILVLFYFVINCMYLSVIETLPVFEVITTANVVKKK